MRWVLAAITVALVLALVSIDRSDAVAKIVYAKIHGWLMVAFTEENLSGSLVKLTGALWGAIASAIIVAWLLGREWGRKEMNPRIRLGDAIVVQSPPIGATGGSSDDRRKGKVHAYHKRTDAVLVVRVRWFVEPPIRGNTYVGVSHDGGFCLACVSVASVKKVPPVIRFRDVIDA